MARVKGLLTPIRNVVRYLNWPKGYFGARSKQYRAANQSVMKALSWRLCGPQAAQARFPAPVDHPHQRGCPHQRHLL